MKFPPPNYTQTPNIFFDQIVKTLKEGELRIMLVLMRQTFGWHKDEDRISLSKLAEKTGMERRSAYRSIASLMEKGLVMKRIEGVLGRERCFYSINLEHVEKEPISEEEGFENDEDHSEIENISTSDLKSLPRDSRVPTLGTRQSLTKETLTKETLINKQQQAASPAAAVSSEKKKEQQQAYQVKPKPMQADRKQVHDILRGNIKVPDADKIEITKRYDEVTVKNALERTEQDENKIRDSYIAYLKMCCQKGLKPAKKQMTVFEELSQHFKNGELYNQAECYLNTKWIAFYRGQKQEQMELGKYFNWEKFLALCDRFGIKFQRHRGFTE